ncbi:RNase P subunit p30 [Xylariomycetidae sp. FL2044]|nr:RNase P subunit p30 [Xylariomycetidae sp. FL2044]
MLYDLNIPWSPRTTAQDLDRTLRFSASLGYDVVALNHVLEPPIGQVANPLPKPASHAPSTSSSAPSSSLSFSRTKSAAEMIKENNNNSPLPTVLHRATVCISDPAQDHKLGRLASTYQILAVRPLTERAFQAACVTIPDHSLISLDLTTHFPFHFRPKPCMAAVHRGVRFEVCYAQALAADPRGRAQFIGNLMQLVRATRGRGIVVSSEAAGGAASQLRAPADVVNLLGVWGLVADKARDGMGTLARGVVVNEGIKRSGFRGVVEILGAAERDDVVMGEGGDAEGGAVGARQEGGKNKNNGSNQGNNNAKKRKNNDSQSNNGNNAEGEPPAMSKRQAKKLKKAALQKEKEKEKEGEGEGKEEGA